MHSQRLDLNVYDPVEFVGKRYGAGLRADHCRCQFDRL